MCTVCGCGGKARVGLAYGGARRKPATAVAAHGAAGTAHRWRALATAEDAAPATSAAATAAAEAHPATRPEHAFTTAETTDRASAAHSTEAGAAPTPSAAHHHLHFGAGPARAHVPGLSQGEMLRIERDILGKNDALAARNRAHLAARGILALNLVSSPGSGKTSLLVRTLQMLAGRTPAAVIEGEDKPLKYPDRFAAADLMLLNKIDLLPHLQFDVQRAIDYALRVNPRLQVIRTSATSGEGLDEWLAWLESRLADTRRAAAPPATAPA